MTPVLLNAPPHAPDAKVLQRQFMKLAILALVQTAALPRQSMCARQNVRITSRSPVLSLPNSASSSSWKIRASNIGAAVTAAIAQEMDAYVFPVIC
jgi:hypothetical protein